MQIDFSALQLNMQQWSWTLELEDTLINSVVNVTICDYLRLLWSHCFGPCKWFKKHGLLDRWLNDLAPRLPTRRQGVIKESGSLASLASLDFLHMDPPMETCSIFLKRFTICRDHVGLRGLSSLMILCGSRGWVICSLQRGGEALGLDLRSTDSDGQWISRGVGVRVPNPKSRNKKLQETTYFQSLGPHGPVTAVLGRCRKRFGCAWVSNLVVHSALVGGLDQGILPVPKGAFRIFFASETLFRMRHTCGNVREWNHFLIFRVLCFDVCCLRIFKDLLTFMFAKSRLLMRAQIDTKGIVPGGNRFCLLLDFTAVG